MESPVRMLSLDLNMEGCSETPTEYVSISFTYEHIVHFKEKS